MREETARKVDISVDKIEQLSLRGTTCEVTSSSFRPRTNHFDPSLYYLRTTVMIQSYWNLQILSCHLEPIPDSAWSKAWVCGRLLAGMADSNPDGARMSVPCECCVLSEVCATGRSPVRRSPTGYFCVYVCVCMCVCVCV